METLIKKWFDHGKSVNEWYEKLCNNPEIIGIEKVINWFKSYQKVNLFPYHYNHDISKPYIIEYDENGNPHYPNHSYHSHLLYIERFGHDQYADMILHDMDFHKKRGDDINKVWLLHYSNHLYATAWAEIYANSELFGGIDSTSFKIKRKQLIKALSRYRMVIN
jgi:hypothetical protein